MAKKGFRHKLTKLHRLRKKKERLPPWKRKWNNFNEKYFGWLEIFVEKMIPWLVLILLLVLIGEYSHYINIFHWNWLEQVSEFFHHYESKVNLLDQVIVSFFIVDLYFNFFKKKTISSFVKTSILDIIAVAPLGLFFRVAEVGEAQTFLHVGAEVEKGAAKVIKEAEIVPKIAKAEEFTKLARLKQTTKTTKVFSRLHKAILRIPRLFRLHRLTDFWKKKK